jgi:RAD50-interacting protein 1
MISDMNEALKLLDWPSQINKSSQKTIQGLHQLNLAFKKLSVFQQPTGSATATVILPSGEASGPLLPFKVMAKGIDIRFRYHFEGDRPTNNLEKVSNIR